MMEPDFKRWRCPCGTYIYDAEYEKAHAAGHCSADPIEAISEAIRLIEVQRANSALIKAIKSLVGWKPEMGGPRLENPPCGECGLEKLPYHEGAEAKTDHDFTEPFGDDVPFMSEAYLYPLLGKEDARSLLAYTRRVASLAGYKGDI